MDSKLRFGHAFTQLPAGMPPIANLRFHEAKGADIMNKWFDQRGLSLYDIPGSGFHGTPEVWMHTKEPVTGPNDLFPIFGVAAGDAVSILYLMGIGSVYMPAGELSEAMERGVIQRFEYGSAAANYAKWLHEGSNYAYLSPTRAPTQAYEFLVNDDCFNALPTHLKALVVDVAQTEAIKFYEEQVERDEEALAKMKDEGLTIKSLPSSIDDLFVEKAKEFYRDEVEEYPELEEYLEAYFEFAQEWEAQHGFSHPVMMGLD